MSDTCAKFSVILQHLRVSHDYLWPACESMHVSPGTPHRHRKRLMRYVRFASQGLRSERVLLLTLILSWEALDGLGP